MEQEFSKLQEIMKTQLEQAQLDIRETMMREMSELLKSFLPQVKGETAVEGIMSGQGDLSSASKFFLDGDSSAPKEPLPQNQPNIGIKPQVLEDEIPDFDGLEKMNRLKQEFSKQLEETKRDLEEKYQVKDNEGDSYGLSFKDLNLVPDVQIPHKFRAPEFEKYEGKTCPDNHLVMYCRKMAGFSNNEKLLIHCFQDSLVGSALRWYNQLTRAQVKSWKDLAKAFKEHYKHVTDMVPNRLLLQGMAQRHNESFREYARRWRETAIQVQPPLHEHEVAPMFVDTLRGVLYDRLIGSPISNFADLVTTGERIENAIKRGRIEDPYDHGSHVNLVGSRTNNRAQDRPCNQSSWFPKRQKVQHSVPVSYTKLLPELIERKLLTPVYSKPKNPPYPKGYDVNATCDYHIGSIGHTTESCGALKNKVQALIEKGLLKF